MRNVASFAHYYAKHASDSSEVFADLDAATFTAVPSTPTAPKATTSPGSSTASSSSSSRHCRGRRGCPATRNMLAQQDFAEFVEDNARDVAPNGTITAADLLEIAQHFQAHTKVNFTQAKRLATGQTQLIYTEDIEAKAGDRGDIMIPSEFDLAITPYEDSGRTIMAARFRYRLAGGRLTLGYFLNDPDRTAREACAEIAGKLAETCKVTVMHGCPA